ncbi:Adhesive plaque matrix protein like [Argiope bruennichi]|uniref:Adhesive plaque matrix protein like n=1 Tax=Argiope bruennichi TaxID=94029 RepID=A0A8T0FEY5_ARGBR|nr:Adhesive plaque matrix protein like [Argiope bruennichi]
MVYPDTFLPYMVYPDTFLPYMVYPDTFLPYMVYPDGVLPDTTYPDTVLPYMVYPDTLLPDMAYPDTALPDTAYPDTAFIRIFISDVQIVMEDHQIERYMQGLNQRLRKGWTAHLNSEGRIYYMKKHWFDILKKTSKIEK